MKAKTKINYIIVLALSFVLSCGLFFGFTVKRVAAEANPVAMTAGAWIRADSEENSGVKFQGKIDKAYYDGLVESYGEDNVFAGIIVVPTDYVKKAGKITFDSLNATNLAAGKAEAAGTEKLKTDGDNYTFFATINKILADNYTRSFSATSYVKVVSDETVEGFTEYDGAYYRYADYKEEDNSRDVFKVAASAYADKGNTESEKAIIKNYLDGVASVVNENGNVSFEQIEGYVSPFTLKKISDKNYAIISETGALKGMKYNGERKTDYRITDGDVSVSAVLHKGATFGEDNTVTMATKAVPGSTVTKNFAYMDNNYVAFKGSYGIGTYVTFTFKGNNLPQVMLFANEINGNMSNVDYVKDGTAPVNGNKGLLISNGAVCSEIKNNTGLHKFFVSGHSDLNRISGDVYERNAAFYQGYSIANSAQPTLVDESYAQMTQIGLSGDYAENEYLYSVGTFLTAESKVSLDIKLYKKVGEYYLNVLSLTRATSLTEADVEEAGDNIIAYATIKGEGKTDFGFDLPAEGFKEPEKTIKTNGATINGDSVTLAGKRVAGAGHVPQISLIDNSYIAFTDYTVGKYMEFTFTGNNMPQMTFFANEINGNMTNYRYTGANLASVQFAENTGITLINGCAFNANSTNHAFDTFTVWGTNRIVGNKTNATAQGTIKDYMSGALFNYTYAENGALNYFTQQGLSEAADTEFKYVVGTKVAADGYVHIEGTLTSKDGATSYGSFDVNTKLTQSEAEALGGNVIAYGTIKGSENATAFTYCLPYVK